MYELLKTCFRGSKGGAVVEHLPPTNVTWVQILAFKATCGLSLLLVLSVALRRFSLRTLVFPSHQKPTTLPNSNSNWNAWTCLKEFITNPNCFVGKQITIASGAGRALFLLSPFSLVMKDLCGREEIKFPVE